MALITVTTQPGAAPIQIPENEIANARTIYPQLQIISGPGGATTTAMTTLPTSYTAGGVGYAPGGAPSVAVAPAAATGALPGILAAIGIPAGLITAGVGAYGLAQMLGLQMPWESGPGEGFIAPWTRPQVRDEAGQWVTAETRPDLFPGGGVGAGVGALGAMGADVLGGVMVRKMWTNASRDGSIPATVESVMLTNGKVITRSLITGEIKTHRPKKHIVISSDPRLSSIRKLDRVQKKITKLVRKYAPRKVSVQAPSAYLSAVERKRLKAAT